MHSDAHTEKVDDPKKCEGDECPHAGYTKTLYPFLHETFAFDAPVSEAVVKTTSKTEHEWA